MSKRRWTVQPAKRQNRKKGREAAYKDKGGIRKEREGFRMQGGLRKLGGSQKGNMG